MAYFGAAYFGRSYFGNAYWGTGTGQVIQHGDWQIVYQDDSGRKKRWRKDVLDREELREIIRKAVLGEIPAIAEFVEPAKQLSDTSSVRDALAPKDYAMSFTVDYEAVMADIAALQAVLSWHYKRQVEVLRAEDDDDSVIALLM